MYNKNPNIAITDATLYDGLCSYGIGKDKNYNYSSENEFNNIEINEIESSVLPNQFTINSLIKFFNFIAITLLEAVESLANAPSFDLV